uniref:Uncharacterized protein n=1 Tax=Arion vulgaris TaxID=1028688 RepID=A0A0B6ZNG9_9EUPU
MNILEQVLLMYLGTGYNRLHSQLYQKFKIGNPSMSTHEQTPRLQNTYFKTAPNMVYLGKLSHPVRLHQKENYIDICVN